MNGTAAGGTFDLDDTAELPALTGLLVDDATLDTIAMAPGAVVLAGARDDDEEDDGGATREAPFMPPTDAVFADGVREVEQWIEAQRAQVAAAEGEIARLRDAQAETLLRVSTTSAELAGVREVLSTERTRAADLAAALGTHSSTIDAERARAAELAAALKERDGAVAALRADLETIRAELERRDGELASARASIEAERIRAIDGERSAADSASALARVRAELEGDLQRARAAQAGLHADLVAERDRAAALLERLQRRDFSRGVIETVLREREADLSDALARVAALESERDRSVADLLADRERATASLVEGHRAALESLRVDQERELAELRRDGDAAREALAQARAGFQAELDRVVAAQSAERGAVEASAREAAVRADERINVLESARAALAAELESLRSAHAAAVAARAALDARLGDAGSRDAQHAARIAELEEIGTAAIRTAAAQSEAARAAAARAVEAERIADEARRTAASAEARCREVEARLADLDAPRRAVEAELARTVAELEDHRRRLTSHVEMEQQLRTALDRTSGALEEREMMLAQMERRAATSAYALGRIKTTMERAAPAPPAAPRWVATLTRSDGDGAAVTLGRTTRIGRAGDNDLCVQAVGVSRHHAVVTTGLQGTHIEDLNSTNGIRVNGRRVQRQRLNDGDHVSIGTAEYTFRRVEHAESGDPAARDESTVRSERVDA